MIWKIWKISVLVIITPKETSSSSTLHLPPPVTAAAAAAAMHTREQQQQQPPPPFSSSSAAAAAAAATSLALKFHQNTKIKNKTKHIMKISHINVNIYDKTATFSPYLLKPQSLKSNVTCVTL
jgi:hypothetical protein